ncbi:6916_t:CDS:2 [Funneliformis caledonium]|uniref:6916_t:CDS:1 n=1 Tax=Funneliformis caledonium TaxID=1117310 RepID=A0A9N9N668_9GLOM|nr:6916_t:CDS:2 [Funneliformis caledonium]
MGDLADLETEYCRYTLEINDIINYYDKTTEIRKMTLKWKEDFKISYKLLTCKIRVVYSSVVSLQIAYSHKHLEDKRSNLVKLFWNLQKIILESEIVDENPSCKGMIEFEGIGLNHLKKTSFIMQEKQVSSYKQNASKIDEETVFIQSDNTSTHLSLHPHEKDLNNITNQNKEDEEMLNVKVELPNYKKVKKVVKNTSRTKSQKSRNKSEDSFSELPSSDIGPNNDEEINFDFTSVEMKLLREQLNEWKVSTVNVSQRFKNYQIETLEKAKIYRLKWCDFYEVLELSSIIVLSLHCPYPSHIFTGQEWQTIIIENSYIVADSILPTEISSSLWNASADSLERKTVFLFIDDSEIS